MPRALLTCAKAKTFVRGVRSLRNSGRSRSPASVMGTTFSFAPVAEQAHIHLAWADDVARLVAPRA